MLLGRVWRTVSRTLVLYMRKVELRCEFEAAMGVNVITGHGAIGKLLTCLDKFEDSEKALKFKQVSRNEQGE